MRFDVVTIFPQAFPGPLALGVTGRALERGLLEVRAHDLRAFTHDRHRQVDDIPYGGGRGMVMKPEPFFAAVRALKQEGEAPVVLLTPDGVPFRQEVARGLARLPRVILLCGRYEGVDARVHEALAHEELSLGDYVLTGGELAAMVVIDATARLLDGVLGGGEESVRKESFTEAELEFPQYTRPPVFEGLAVPEVLLSGNHAVIEDWRRTQAQERTRARRPDLLAADPKEEKR
jgi:tRNA (guanine37-N1)-methyltransferase